MKKGEITGCVIGKYGVDIFAGVGIAKGMKLYRHLKKANNVLTFETMALSKNNASLIKLEATRRAQTRSELFKHAKMTIQWDKQGKHIKTHRNYQPFKNKSILDHPNPQKLVDDFAGKGMKIGNKNPGTSGYYEVIDFGEFIGYAVDESTGAKMATNWGKIHYAGDGVHIVPTRPRM